MINPNTTASVTEDVRKRFEVYLPGVDVSGITATIGAPAIASETTFATAQYAVIRAFEDYAASPVYRRPDCIVVACFGDPGVYALREIIQTREPEVPPIPIYGLAEGSMRHASSKHGKFAIITGGTQWGPMLGRLASSINMQDHLFRVYTITPNCVQLGNDRPAALAMLSGECRKAVEEMKGVSGASSRECNSIIIAGASLAGMAGEIADQFDVPLIDCIQATAAWVAEDLKL